MKRLIYWFIFTPCVLLLVLFAIHSENAGFSRVAQMAVIVQACLCIVLCPMVLIVACVCPDKLPKDRNPRTVPFFLQLAFDLATVGACCYAGWTAAAIFGLIDCICGNVSMAFIEEAIKTKAEPTA